MSRRNKLPKWVIIVIWIFCGLLLLGAVANLSGLREKLNDLVDRFDECTEKDTIDTSTSTDSESSDGSVDWTDGIIVSDGLDGIWTKNY